MWNRSTETATLHFDLSHCPPDQPFSLSVLGTKYPLARHTPHSLSRHGESNRLLGLLSAEQLQRVTHFVEEIQLPADAVGIHLVTYPHEDPNRIPNLALPFVHVPAAARRRYFREMEQRGARQPHPSALTHFGITAESLALEHAASVRLDATSVVTPFQAAETFIFSHPDLLTTRQDVAASVLYGHIGQALHRDPTLPLYISANGPGTPNPYVATATVLKPGTQTPYEPVTDYHGKPIVDRNGQPITWPKDGDGNNVIQQYRHSTGVIGSPDGRQPGAAAGAVSAVLRSVKDDLSLNGQLWTKQHGITVVDRQHAPAPPTPAPARAISAAGAPAPSASGFQWNLSSLTSMYGVDLGSLTYDPSSQQLSLDVTNWANRCLGVYVLFYDETGAAIGTPSYLTMLFPGNTMAGIPVGTGPTTLNLQVPDNATRGDVLLGGLGQGPFDGDVDKKGIAVTMVLNFAVPLFLIGLTVGTAGAKKTMVSAIANISVTTVVNAIEKAFPGGSFQTRSLIAAIGEVAAGVIFSAGMERLAVAVTEFATVEEVVENVPIVGWAFEAVSCATGLADLAASSAEVASSPFTYVIEVARVIDVQVDVSPDPTHGTAGQPAIWPLESDHWEVAVQYRGGTTIRKTGTMDAIKPDTPLSVLFSDDTAISAAPGAQIQLTASFYSATGWLCGKWCSGWIAAVAPDGSTTLTVQGSIIEFLVPLSSQTQYGHYQKLAFDGGRHVWDRAAAQPTAVFSGSTDCANTGNVLCRPVGITINDLDYALAYTYQASGQGLPLDFSSGAQNGQMYAFQSVSVLGDPEAGMKQPSVGFSLQPYIAYDQFGPAPLFSLPSAAFQPELDGADGAPVPGDLAAAFARAGGAPAAGSGAPPAGSGSYALPAGAVVTVVTASAAWYVGVPGQPMYELRRETDDINVFRHPTPAFSPRNYYLDTRATGTDYLRQVVLDGQAGTFDYTPGMSWGGFPSVSLDALVVHPNAYVLGVSYEFHKLMILQLPGAAVADGAAQTALAMSGQGVREGLLRGPVALTVTADGRILVLEQDNARIQAFDTMGNPVQCFAGPLSFPLDAGFGTELNAAEPSPAFRQAYQRNVQPQLAVCLRLPSTLTADLDAGTVSDALREQFKEGGYDLSDAGPFQLLASQPGNLWLLLDQGSGAAYDIRKDLYVKQGATELFTLPASLAGDLDGGTASAALQRQFAAHGVTLSAAGQLQVTVDAPGAEWVLTDAGSSQSYTITAQSNAYVYLGSTLLFSLPAGATNAFGASGPPPQDLVDRFTAQGIQLSASSQLSALAGGTGWQLVDPAKGTYDIVMEPDVDVFRAPALEVTVVAPDAHWLLRDRVNTLTFDITADAAGTLLAQQLVSTMALRDGASSDVRYLDIGVETKGFVYVLSYAGSGGAVSDYRLDIYNPDGSWLTRTLQVNGARFTVDQWRNVYTLNYESLLGPNGRTEPTVSTWTPSTPTGGRTTASSPAEGAQAGPRPAAALAGGDASNFYGVVTQVISTAVTDRPDTMTGLLAVGGPGWNSWDPTGYDVTWGGTPEDIADLADALAPMSVAVAVFNLYPMPDGVSYGVQSQMTGGYAGGTWALGLGSPAGYCSWVPDNPTAYDSVQRCHTYSGLITFWEDPEIRFYLQWTGYDLLGGVSAPDPNPTGQFGLVWYTLADILAGKSSTFPGGVVLPFRYADLHGLALAGASWCNSDFSNANLASTDFAGADLSGVAMAGANLARTRLTGTLLAQARLAHLDLTPVDVDAGPAKFYTPPLAPPSTASPLTSLAGSTLNQSLLGSDWALLDLTGATIRNLDAPVSSAHKPLSAQYSVLTGLNGSNLTGLTVRNAVFDHCTLEGLDFSHSDLAGTSFKQASLHGANFTNAHLQDANLAGAQLGSLRSVFTLPAGSQADLNEGPVDAALAAQFQANGITLSATAGLAVVAAGRVWTLTDTAPPAVYTIRLEPQAGAPALTVYQAAMACSLVNAYMPNAVLTGANLYGVLASQVQFYGSGARLDGSAILEEAQFNDANLSAVDFTQAQLMGANLSNAMLFNAKFNGANLTPSATGVAANLSGANLQGADFTDAKLDGATLANAAVAIAITSAEAGVYLFSLPYAKDTTRLDQYTAELAAAATQFSLNPDGDPGVLQRYVGDLNSGRIANLAAAFAQQTPPVKLSSSASVAITTPGTVWAITDGRTSYTLWTGVDDFGQTELYAAPSIPLLRTAFTQNGRGSLRWQAGVSAGGSPGQWIIDNDSQNPQNTATGYMRFFLELNGSGVDVYGTSVRIIRMGDDGKNVYDTETCNVTTIGVTNMDPNTICPNGTKLSVNQGSTGKSWDDAWLRAAAPPAPPTCVPTETSFCPPTVAAAARSLSVSRDPASERQEQGAFAWILNAARHAWERLLRFIADLVAAILGRGA